MSAERLPLWHVLYTNVPGVDGQGFRTILEHFDGPPEEGARVGRWLAELRLAAGAACGWATNVFALDGAQHATLALLHSSFTLDEHQRGGGHLAHALLVRVSERERAGDFGRALFDRAREFVEFVADGEGEFGSYLEGCRLAPDLEVPALDPANLLPLGPDFLLELFQVATENPAQPEVTFSGAEDDELAERLVQASAALPPKLRLNLRWAVGLQSAPAKTFLARAAQPGELAHRIYWSDGASTYRDWLWKQLQERRFDEVRRIIQRWNIVSWPQLLEVITLAEHAEATVAPPARVDPTVAAKLQIPVPPSGTTEQGTTERKPTPSGAKVPSTRKDAAEYEREFQALQASIREYVDKRLELLVAPLPAPATGRKPSRLWRYRAEVYFAIALVLIGWLALKVSQLPQADVDPVQSTDLDDPTIGVPSIRTSRTSPLDDVLANAEPIEVWREHLRMNAASVALWFRAVAEADDLEPHQVSSLQRRNFAEMADELATGQELTADEARSSVTGLFEYVHARWAWEVGRGRPSEDVVTLNPGEVDRHLVQFVTSLGLADRLGTSVSSYDPKVQVAVVLRRLEQGAP